MELKKERADNFVTMYMHSGKPLGYFYKTIMNTYLRFVDIDNNKNQSRYEKCGMWEKFIDIAGRTKLTNKPEEKDLEDKYRWLEEQCSKSMAMIVMYEDGDFSVMDNIVKKGIEKMKDNDYRFVKRKQEERKKKWKKSIQKCPQLSMKLQTPRIQKSIRKIKVTLKRITRKVKMHNKRRRTKEIHR